MSYKFDFSFLAERWPDFVAGAWLTVQLTVLSIALGFAVGTVCALVRVYGNRCARLVGFYVELIRNTPLLVQIFIVYFGLSSLGLKLSAEVSAVIALVVNMGAYTTEIMRAGIQSIQRTQLEAADCLGLTRLQTIVHVVLLPAMERVYPAAVEPVRAADARLLDHLADLGRGAHRHRQPRAVRHLPQLRGLHRSWPSSISPCRCSTASASGRSGWSCSSASAGWARRCDPAQRQPSPLSARGGALDAAAVADRLRRRRRGRPAARAAARVAHRACCAALASGYIQLIQGTPLLILLFLSYFGLRHPGLQARPLVAAGLSLTLYAAAFLGEIWRGCIEAVPQTQWEASDCLGLNSLPAVCLRDPAAGGAASPSRRRSASWCRS